MPSSIKKPCSVCGDSGDGAHFGAEACRACAAFFRRSVAMQKSYSCRNGGRCEIQSNIRCMCRSCRFNKCLVVGMRKTAVQRHRDMLGKRAMDGDGESAVLGPETSCLAMELSYFPEDQGMPTLKRLRDNYNQICSARKILHSRDGESLFTTREPRAVTYKEANSISVKEIGLVADFLVHSFGQFASLESTQKKLLYRNFFLSFVLLETGYFCTMKDRTDILFLPTGDFIDAQNPGTFYYDEEGKQLMSSEDAVRLFSPSFSIYRRNILEPMRVMKVTDIEFFVLCSCVLWDHGIEGQSDDCEKVANSTRSEIIRELMYYHRYVHRESEQDSRLSQLLLLLPALQRAVRRFQEDVEISNVFNAYKVDEKFYELTNSKF